MSRSLTRAFIGLGSNIGNPAAQLSRALETLEAAGVLRAASGVYRSAPIGPEQPEFLNMVAELSVSGGPYDLLGRCGSLEADAQRVRGQRWGPRTLDVDVLLFGNVTLSEPDLVIPHPRMRERRFVLDPLAEIAPELVAEQFTETELAAVAHQACERICDPDALPALAASP